MTTIQDNPKQDSANRNYWQGEKILLRAVEPEDAEAFFNFNLDSEMARTIDFLWPPKSMAATREWTQRTATEEPKDDRVFLVMEDKQGLAVGTISTHGMNRRAGTFAYGISVDIGHRGHGYASEAIVLLLRYFFAELGYQKATVPVYEFNPASIRLHEKVGFVLEGRLRRVAYTRGQYYDELFYGITREEFEERYGFDR